MHAGCEDFDTPPEQIRGEWKMTSVALYSEQPILTAGFQRVMAGLEDLTLSAAFTDLDPFMEHVQTHRPSVVLLDMTAAVTFATLSKLKSIAGDVPIILWVDVTPMEFVSQALALGIRGFLRRCLPIELQIKCLRNVAAGDLWVEQGLCDRLLTSERIVVSRRQRQLLSLLAQGLKNKEIAHAMTLTEGTIKVYLSRLFRKVGANDRFELALYALKNLFVGPASEPEPASAAGESRPSAPLSPAFFLPTFVTVARPAAIVH
jgi:DNA-binding NarL/FixJ family response regulator